MLNSCHEYDFFNYVSRFFRLGLLRKPELYQNVQILNLPFYDFFSSVVAGSGTDGEDH